MRAMPSCIMDMVQYGPFSARALWGVLPGRSNAVVRLDQPGGFGGFHACLASRLLQEQQCEALS